MQPTIARHWSPLDRLRRGLVAAIALLCAVVPGAPIAAPPSIDTIVVKLRADAASGNSATLAASDRDALLASLRSAFSIVGHTREGAYLLQLAAPLAIDDARASINRARLLPQVLYVNVEDPGGASADPTGARAALARHPPVFRLIVKYRDASISAGAARNDALPTGNLDRLAGRAGQPVAQQRAMAGGAYVVRLFQSLPVDQAGLLARSLENDPAIEYAVPDLRKMPLLVPNDPLYTSQWHYMSPPSEPGGVNLPPAWSITTGAPSIAVAVLDTGSLALHPDLAGRYTGGYDFISDAQVGNDGDARDPNPADPGDWITSAENAAGLFQGCGARNSTFHGTHVAGTIGAASNNLTGVTGINWVSKIVPIRVLGKCGGYTSDIADGVRWAAGLAVPGVPANANPARVMNLSLGGYACDINGLNCHCEAVMQDAIDAAVAAGSVVVVAAGNSNRPATETSPANCNGVITVGATGRLGERASYSNYGAMVEISAPGGAGSGSVLSTVNTGATSPTAGGYSYGAKQGTSMATPHVAGIASLMLSVNPALTPGQVTSKLQTTARAFP
ncbi:MAG: S8 family peptidase, partial [Betaproteobacteria bacterium]